MSAINRGKRTLLTICFTLLALHTLPALGIGLHREWSLLGDAHGSAALNLSGEALPLVLKLGGTFENDSPTLLAAVDYHLFRLPAGRTARLYAGAGIRSEIGETTLYGVELPAGVSFYPLQVGELFCEIAPNVNLVLDDSTELTSGFSALVGFRIHF